METNIFVNLPVKDLARSRDFFTRIGFSFNEQFSDETGACLVISENIFAMLLTHEKFRQFTRKEIADSTKTTEVLTALSFESKEKVYEIMDKVLAAGGTEAREKDDHGFMYARSFNDPDGHIWEPFWMDTKAIPQQ